MAGFGQHVWNLPGTHLVKMMKVRQFLSLSCLLLTYWPETDFMQYTWAIAIVYPLAIWLAKASLLFQLSGIFTPMKSGYVYWACHTLIWVNLLFYISVFFSIVFACHPIEEVWSLGKPSDKSHCVSSIGLLVASSAVNILSDLLNLLLPMWATWHLQLAPKRKAGIIAIFATGLL